MLNAIELYNLRDKTIGEKIVWLREHKSKDENGNYCFLSSKKLAKQLEMSPDTLNRIEKSGNCTSEKLLDIADYFEVSIDWLLSRKGVGEEYCDLYSVCNYTGLNENTIDFISRSNPEFRNFIDFIVSYAKDNRLVFDLENIGRTAKLYQQHLLMVKLLSSIYDKNGGQLDDDIKQALYQTAYKTDILKQDDKTILYFLSQFRDSYIAEKYRINEKLKDLLNEFSVSELYTDNYDKYSFDKLENDEITVFNSDYLIDTIKKRGTYDETQEKKS